MRVVANSVPKSGTNLLSRLLVLLGLEQKRRLWIHPRLVSGRFSSARQFFRAREPEKVTVGVVTPQQIGRRWLARRLSRVPNGCFVNAHCIYTPELAELFRGEGLKTVCLLRDPRDLAVSQMHYLKHNPPKNFSAHEAFIALSSDQERLLVCIRGGELGGRKLQSLDQRYRQFLGWEQDEGAVVVKFEDLVGPRGGGSAEVQRQAVERVATHVGISVNERTMRLVEENLFGVGRTFRKGQIGGWREEFSPEHERAAKEVAGPLLVELGYEAGPNW
jgi:sulfotransferase 6B1